MGLDHRLCASDRRLVIRTIERLLLRSPSGRVRPEPAIRAAQDRTLGKD